jgi:hypothetical protein
VRVLVSMVLFLIVMILNLYLVKVIISSVQLDVTWQTLKKDMTVWLVGWLMRDESESEIRCIFILSMTLFKKKNKK